MKFIRKRARVDNFNNQRREQRRSWGRLVYGLLLLALAFGVGDHFYGDLLFMRADGVVVRDRVEVATTYTARVEEILVTPGDEVNAGDLLLRVESAEMLERLADLSIRRAETILDETEFQVRAQVAEDMTPLAEYRARQSVSALNSLEQISNVGLVSASRRESAMRSAFESEQARLRLVADRALLNGRIEALAHARQASEHALAKLRQHYNGGRVLAPAAGRIGSSVPVIGEVVTPSDPIMSVQSGLARVVAYLPRHRLFTIEEGMEVHVDNGTNSSWGRIAKILEVTAELPPEFQTAFRPPARSQLALVEIDDIEMFPLDDKVIVRRPVGEVALDYASELSISVKSVLKRSESSGRTLAAMLFNDKNSSDTSPQTSASSDGEAANSRSFISRLLAALLT